jgi:hypothetical protein
MPSENVDAQMAHFAIGCALVWASPSCFASSPWWGVWAVVYVSCGKEFVFDLLIEKDKLIQKDKWQGSLQDFVFYQLGWIFAIVFWYATAWIRPLP